MRWCPNSEGSRWALPQDAGRVGRVASAEHLRLGRDNTAIYHSSAHRPRALLLWSEHWAVTKTNFIIRSPLSILRLAPIIGGSYVTIYHLSGAPPTLCPTRAADNQTQGYTLRAIFCLNGNAMRCFWWKLWFFRVTISILTISISFPYRAGFKQIHHIIKSVSKRSCFKV